MLGSLPAGSGDPDVSSTQLCKGSCNQNEHMLTWHFSAAFTALLWVLQLCSLVVVCPPACAACSCCPSVLLTVGASASASAGSGKKLLAAQESGEW